MILDLKPKDVKEFGISKQTLWNMKEKISYNQFDGISIKIKFITINYFETTLIVNDDLIINK